jgi:hypothetical protein
MSPEQARVLLVSELPLLKPELIGQLLVVTGLWPLLLRLVNRILANAVQAGADVAAVGAQLLERLQVGGPGVIDDISGTASRSFDVGKPKERARAVRATIEASTSLLTPQGAARFTDLGVFAEDETIPFGLLAGLWREKGGLDELETVQLTARLIELALVTSPESGTPGIALHDVVRDFLRGELGPAQLAKLHKTLLAAAAADLPAAIPILSTNGDLAYVAWWDLGADRYLWDHLIEHLRDAGLSTTADVVAGDLRWVGARLQRYGPAAPVADLSVVNNDRAARLRVALGRIAHLLAPTEPPEAVVDVLYSRVAEDREQAAAREPLAATRLAPFSTETCLDGT